MTRANIIIITNQGKFNFQSNSSAYPSYLGEDIINFATSVASRNRLFSDDNSVIGFYDNPDSRDLATLIEECGLQLGLIGNFSYVYEIDFVKQTVKVWDYTTYWINAPNDWKERGWKCWMGDNGRYGYTNWRKNKLLYSANFKDLVTDVLTDNRVVVNELEIEKIKKCDKN